jgi:hypothetical protein
MIKLLFICVRKLVFNYVCTAQPSILRGRARASAEYKVYVNGKEACYDIAGASRLLFV